MCLHLTLVIITIAHYEFNQPKLVNISCFWSHRSKAQTDGFECVA